jgi:hypothetical protein
MLIEKILKTMGKTHNSIAKAKHGTSPQFTVVEVLHRVVKNPSLSIKDLFPEVNPVTSSKMLKQLFPKKTIQSQSWFTYILGTVQHKYCPKCKLIKSYTEYNKGSCGAGLQFNCKSCDTQYQKDRYQNHKAEFKAKHIEYTLHRKHATPAWANIEKMNKMYKECKLGNHIDHIIPLNNPIVCGLHNEFNLQEISAYENQSKGNKFDIDTYIHTMPN